MNNKYVFGFFLAAAGFLSAMHPVPARAQESPRILISEINWAGSELSTADEWLYLDNTGQTDIDASGFVLTGAATSGGALSIESGTIIKAGARLLISNYPLGSKSVLTVTPDLVTTALSLPNSGLHIMLTTPDGTVIDEVNFGSTHHYGSTDPLASAVRNLDTLEWSTAGSETPPVPPLTTEEPVEVMVTEPDPAPESESSSINEPAATPAVEPIIENIVEPVPEAIVEPTVTVVEESTSAEVPPAEATMDNTVTTDATAMTVPAAIEAPDPVVEENTMVTSDPISESAPTIVEEPDNTQTEPDPVVSTTDSISTVVTYQSGAVVVNEIMSNPAEGENEWIKLFNPGETTIDLTGWFVTDATDKKTVLEGQIETHGYFIIDSPKGKLNNDGDEVNLFAADGTLIDQLIYGTAEIKAPKKDEPLNRADIQKSVTEESYDAPSPTLPTITAESTPVPVDQSKPTEDVVDLPAPTPAVHRIIAVAAPEISSVAKKTTSAKTNTTRKASTNALARTKISGVVTALPGTFGEQIMFIDGIQVYANNKDWPTLQLGDVVAVSGTRSSNRGEQRIKIKTAADIYITSSQVLTPVEVESSQLESLPEGRLVMISGRVVYRDGDRLTVEDKTGVMTAVAYAKTDVSWTDLSSTQVRITGVLRHIDGQNLIYPRTSDDVEFIDDAPTVAPMASGTIDESSNFDWLGYGAYALLGGALAILAFWFLRSLKNPKLTNE